VRGVDPPVGVDSRERVRSTGSAPAGRRLLVPLSAVQPSGPSQAPDGHPDGLFGSDPHLVRGVSPRPVGSAGAARVGVVTGHMAGGLRAGFVRSGLSPWELYVAAGLGGYLGPVELEAAVLGLLPWTDREWAITAQAVDEHFRAHHLPYRVPEP